MSENMKLCKISLFTCGLLLCCIILGVEAAESQLPMLPVRYSHEYPANAWLDFSHNIQGVTQDGYYWYVTQTEDLWKFPLNMNWMDVGDGVENVLHAELDDYIDGSPDVSSSFDHMGDLAYHPCGVLIIPLDSDDSGEALLVVNPQDLGGLSWTNFSAYGYPSASFCAVDDEGIVYFPGANNFADVVGYSLNCGDYTFTHTHTRTLVDENAVPLRRHQKQGCTFSPSGDLFVMSTGYGWENSDPVLDGIHIFETEGATWTRIAHSTNGGGLFNYQWDPDIQEPEGMTWLDLDFGSVSGMSGQLHILMLDTILPHTTYFKHYTFRIYVDWASPVGNGTPQAPYPTVSEASALAWDGCEIRIRAGSYNESVTFNRRARLVAVGGTVIIGE